MGSTETDTFDPSAQAGAYNERVVYTARVGRQFLLDDGSMVNSFGTTCGWDGKWTPDPGTELKIVKCKKGDFFHEMTLFSLTEIVCKKANLSLFLSYKEVILIFQKESC